jgi:hypothetical protein
VMTVEIHQATGMAAEQLDCTMLEALGRLIVRARAMNISTDEFAGLVIDRDQRLSEPHPSAIQLACDQAVDMTRMSADCALNQ